MRTDYVATPSFSINVDSRKWQVKWQNHYEKSLLLFITGICNLNCENCFSINSRENKELSLEQVERIIIANPEFDKIDLMGGEPLLHSRVFDIIDLLKKYNKDISIYTNGLALHTIREEQMPIRVCISFHEIENSDRSRKPISAIRDRINLFLSQGNAVKLVFLLDAYNVSRAMEIIEYVEINFPLLDKLTIGLMRHENDYWNDSLPGVLSFEEYAKAVQLILDNYSGKLNLDIFLKGVLRFDGDPGEKEHRVNRFKCVFQNMTYSDCLYNACDPIHCQLPADCKLPTSYSRCKHTGETFCLADKVRLVNIM